MNAAVTRYLKKIATKGGESRSEAKVSAVRLNLDKANAALRLKREAAAASQRPPVATAEPATPVEPAPLAHQCELVDPPVAVEPSAGQY